MATLFEINDMYVNLIKKDNESLVVWEQMFLKIVKNSKNDNCETDIIPYETGKNGDADLRQSSLIHNYFIIEKIYCNGAIVGIRSKGIANVKRSTSAFQQVPEFIRQKIKNKKEPCCFLGDHAEKMEVDHKTGLKEYADETDSNFYVENAYQSVGKHANCAKREACKKCKRSGKRFDARKIGFTCGWVSGTENLNLDKTRKFKSYENPCVGCYMYDPIKFRKDINNDPDDPGGVKIPEGNKMLGNLGGHKPSETLYVRKEQNLQF